MSVDLLRFGRLFYKSLGIEADTLPDKGLTYIWSCVQPEGFFPMEAIYKNGEWVVIVEVGSCVVRFYGPELIMAARRAHTWADSQKSPEAFIDGKAL